LAFHVRNGGISRFEKFKYLFSEILQKPDSEAELNLALESYGRHCTDALLNCETAPGLSIVLNKIREAGSKTFVVSGGLQEELRSIFKMLSLNQYFDGIFGSPDNKTEILTREITSLNIELPAMFVGDSRYDHHAAHSCGLDFIFVSGWTEFMDWKSYFKDKDIICINKLDEIVSKKII